MKDCPKCNKQIPDEAIFCAYCGCNIEQEEKSKAKFCIKCGTPFNDGMMFCMKCGNKLVEDKQDDPWAEVDAQKQDDPWADFADYKEKPSQVAIAQDLYQKGSRLFDEGMESEDSNKLKEAESLLKQAAEMGLTAAQFELGWFYYSEWHVVCGISLDNGDKEAEKWLLLAAEARDNRAQYTLGEFYLEHGDDEKAKYWIKEAAYNGNKDAKKRVKELYRMIIK